MQTAGYRAISGIWPRIKRYEAIPDDNDRNYRLVPIDFDKKLGETLNEILVKFMHGRERESQRIILSRYDKAYTT